MGKISVYEAASKSVTKESVSVSVDELKAYIVKRDSRTSHVKKSPAAIRKRK